MQRLACIFGLGIAALLAQSAIADETPARPSPARGEVRAACEGDVKALCPDVAPGGGRILQCLKEHKDTVSDGCKQAIMKARQSAPDKKS